MRSVLLCEMFADLLAVCSKRGVFGMVKQVGHVLSVESFERRRDCVSYVRGKFTDHC